MLPPAPILLQCGHVIRGLGKPFSFEGLPLIEILTIYFYYDL